MSERTRRAELAARLEEMADASDESERHEEQRRPWAAAYFKGKAVACRDAARMLRSCQD